MNWWKLLGVACIVLAAANFQADAFPAWWNWLGIILGIGTLWTADS